MNQFTRLAYDRDSLRSIDADGHMIVKSSIITCSGCSNYLGSEVINWQALGLNPNQTYSLFRPPEEIRKAASTLNLKPLLSTHRPVNAEDHPHSLVVGCVTNPAWDDPNLTAEFVVWDADLIRAIQDGSQRALSAGYEYQPVLESGTYQGQRYSIRMKALRYNHVTVCAEPRVASAIIGDSKPQKRKWNFAMDISSIHDPDPRFPGPNDTEATYADVLDFLREKLSQEDLKRVMEMFQNPRAMASDAASREIRARRRAAEYADFCKRFPDAARLRNV